LLGAARSLHAQGRFAEAEASFRKLLQDDPGAADAIAGLADVLGDAGRHAEAEPLYRSLLARGSADAACFYNFGNTLRLQRRPEEALALYLEAARLDPGLALAHYNAANLLKETGRLAEAEAAYRRALEADPGFVEAHNNLGATLADLGRLADAAASYREAVRLRPTHALAYNNLGNVLRETGAHEEAEPLYRRTIELRPGLAEGWNHLGNSLLDLGRLEEAERAYRHALEISPDLARAHSNLLLLLNYRPDIGPASLRAEAERFGLAVGHARATPGQGGRRRADGRLRVGYVSGDFRVHSVAFFFAPALDHHDRSRYEITCYQCSPRSDAMTAALRRRADRWREAWRLDDEALAGAIRDDGIDILVDLSGHTSDNRLPVFARRVAPVQVTWLGYPGTTGVPAMDFRITDALVDPAPRADAAHTERLARLSRAMWCFRPDPQMPGVGPLPSAGRAPTFGSFNYLPKLNQAVLAAWARILAAVPGSRLLVTRVPGSASARRILDAFAAHGIDAGRLELHGILDRRDLAQVFGRVDVALDPFPYAGTTTTCEVLWMGVPVVTLAGATTAARSGVSLLSAVGLEACIAADLDAYVKTAVQFGGDRDRLAETRSTLRERFAASPLRDEAGFARALESAYEEMWRSAGDCKVLQRE